jgi:hypothetical protein
LTNFKSRRVTRDRNASNKPMPRNSIAATGNTSETTESWLKLKFFERFRIYPRKNCSVVLCDDDGVDRHCCFIGKQRSRRVVNRSQAGR